MVQGVRIDRPMVVVEGSTGGRLASRAGVNPLASSAAGMVMPVVMAVLAALGFLATFSRVNLLLDWSDRYEGTGQHLVFGCGAEGGSGGDSWVCDGALVPDGSTVDVRADLVTSRGAMVSDRPYVGQRIDTFHDPDRLGVVHPRSFRLNELARLYLSLLPRLLLLGGALIWLAGWTLTRDLDEADLVTRDTVRLPGRFLWQTRGMRWLAVAALVLLGNHLLTTRIIGSLGTF